MSEALDAGKLDLNIGNEKRLIIKWMSGSKQYSNEQDSRRAAESGFNTLVWEGYLTNGKRSKDNLENLYVANVPKLKSYRISVI